MLRPMVISVLAVHSQTKTPVVILREVDGEGTLPIWIGLLEATAIASALQGVTFDRPMTHDLFKNFSEMLNIAVAKVEVCDIKDSTYFAKIHFASKEKIFTMDARPSDAIAIALRFNAPIFIDDKVLQKSKIGEGVTEVVDQSSEGKKWAEYLEKLSPKDFGKFKV